MKQIERKVFWAYWIPRILTIIFILFLGIFALDVFIPGKTIVYYIIALSVHLIPNFLLTFILLIAWKNERVGGLLFLLSAILFTEFFKTYLFLPTFMFISFPLFFIGMWFVIVGNGKAKYKI